MASQEQGTTYFSFADSEENRKEDVLVTHSSAAGQGTLTPTGETYKALPRVDFGGHTLKSNGSKIIVEFSPEVSGDVIESEECDFQLPARLIDPVTGAVTHRVYKLEDFTGFKPSGSVNSAALAAGRNRIATFTKPDGKWLQLDAGKPFAVYWGDDT